MYIGYMVLLLIAIYVYFLIRHNINKDNKKKILTELDVYNDFAQHFKPYQCEKLHTYTINNKKYFGLCYYLIDKYRNKSKISESLYYKINADIRLAVTLENTKTKKYTAYFNSPESRYGFIQNKIKELTKDKL